MDADALVGRDTELAALERRLAAARDGRGCVVLVSGEAGAGKTALADVAAQRAASSGMTVAWGACREGAGTAPYWPWLQILRRLGGPVGFAEAAAGAGDAPPAGASRYRLFDDVVDAVRAAGGDGGLLLVLDDLHWADLASLRLLEAVAGGIAEAAVAVIGLYRAGEPAADAEQGRLLASIGRERVASDAPLRGLDPGAVVELVTRTAGHPVPEALLRDVVARSGGNPLFVRELVRLVDAPSGPAAGLVPAGIRDVVGRRLDRLSPGVADTLRQASVLGREFTAAQLGALADRPEAALLGDLDAAAAAGLVAAAGRAVRFTHVLIQEVLYGQLPSARRRLLHARAADALRDTDAPDTLAHHLREAGPLAGTGEALRVTLEAARRARSQLAYEHAAGQYREALGLLPAGDAGTAQRATVLLDLAVCEFRSGAVEAAWRSCVSAAGIGRAIGAPAVVADAATVLRGVTNSALTPQIHALSREALAGLPSGDTVRTARVLAQLAVTADRFASDAEPGLSRRALVAAEATGDPAALAMALHARHSELLDPEHVLERLTLGGRAVRLGRDTGDTESACWGHLWRLDAFVELGRRAPLVAELSAFATAAEHLREPLWLWRLGLVRACAAAFEGRFAQARVLAAEALAAGRRGGHDAAGFLDLVLASHLALSTGDGLDAVEAGVRAFAERGPFFARGWNVLVLLARGRRDEAAAIWAEIAPHVDTFPRHAVEWLVAASGHAEMCVALGDRATARTVYRQLEPYADRYVAGTSYTPDGGPVSLYLGMLAILDEDWAAAERHLTAALASSRAMGSAPYEAVTRMHLARLRLARHRPGDAPEAARDLDAAGRIATRLGMAPLAARVVALARTTGAALSTREEQVAALVAEGLSNRQIATRLRLSERTAENHVTHILTKLGFDSRARIAVWHAMRTRD